MACAQGLRKFLRPLYGKGKTIPRLILPDDVVDSSDDLPADVEDSSAGMQGSSANNDKEIEMQANLRLKPCGCEARCVEHFDLKDVHEFREQMARASPEQRRVMIFHLMKESISTVEATAPEGQQAWQLFGKPICRAAFMEACNVSKKSFNKFEKAIQLGHLAPLEDQRKHNGSSHSHQAKELNVDAFFSYVYQFLGETLADADQACQELAHKGHGAHILEWIQARDGNALAQASAGTVYFILLSYTFMF